MPNFLYDHFCEICKIICYYFCSICYILDETDPEGEMYPAFEIQLCLEVNIHKSVCELFYISVSTVQFF